MLDQLTNTNSHPKGDTKMEHQHYHPTPNNSNYKWVYPNNLIVTTGNVYLSMEGGFLSHTLNKMVFKTVENLAVIQWYSLQDSKSIMLRSILMACSIPSVN